MSVSISVVGAFLIFLVLWEAFETIVFPRRVTRRIRLTYLFYRASWKTWKGIVRLFPESHQKNLLSIYGPISLILLLTFWALTLIISFGLMHWGLTGISEGKNSFDTNLYFSGTTFFTLGLGDVSPLSPAARFLTVAEAGTGLGFLAILIGYLPALNQSFSRRETNISLLDSRAGSPPTASEILRRHSDESGMESIRQLLHEWERWSAELLESHLSYPVLAYFRSQHDNQSWLAALASVLDASALVMVGVEGACVHQAQLTFAIARHAVVDLCLVFGIEPRLPDYERLGQEELASLQAGLASAGLQPLRGNEANRKLMELRHMYEPFLFGLSRYFELALPPWIPSPDAVDNWQTSISGWDTVAVGKGSPQKRPSRHF